MIELGQTYNNPMSIYWPYFCTGGIVDVYRLVVSAFKCISLDMGKDHKGIE